MLKKNGAEGEKYTGVRAGRTNKLLIIRRRQTEARLEGNEMHLFNFELALTEKERVSSSADSSASP